MLIGHNGLFGDDQEMVEEVEQRAISVDQVEEIKQNLDDIVVSIQKKTFP